MEYVHQPRGCQCRAHRAQREAQRLSLGTEWWREAPISGDTDECREPLTAMPVLHQMQVSGNCYKVRLTARQLGIDLVLKNYGLHHAAKRKPDFHTMSPNGRVPILEFEDGRRLSESDAILWYLS